MLWRKLTASLCPTSPTDRCRLLLTRSCVRIGAAPIPPITRLPPAGATESPASSRPMASAVTAASHNLCRKAAADSRDAAWQLAKALNVPAFTSWMPVSTTTSCSGCRSLSSFLTEVQACGGKGTDTFSPRSAALLFRTARSRGAPLRKRCQSPARLKSGNSLRCWVCAWREGDRHFFRPDRLLCCFVRLASRRHRCGKGVSPLGPN